MHPTLSVDQTLSVLHDGELSIEGRLVDASNATLFCSVSLDGVELTCVYKPVQGERPLWDFPDGTLAGREVSAYMVSAVTGWDLVPPTVLREGPFGSGSCQLWIDVDMTIDLEVLVRSDHPDLRRMAVLDAVLNNADRKGGHMLPMPEGRVYGVDHGLCFSTEDKLRTLLWQWRGEPLLPEADAMLAELEQALREDLGSELAQHLTRREVRRTQHRVSRLREGGVHPFPSGDWPALPWPPF